MSSSWTCGTSKTNSLVVEPSVVNASPLIVLSRAGFLELLKLTGDSIVVPRPVADEVRTHRDDAGARALRENPWLRTVTGSPISDVIRGWDLGDGESSVLAWAQNHAGSVAIVDDLAARKCAASLSIPVRGTLGLVLLAKSRGAVSSARPIVEELRRAGLYLSDSVMDRILALVGE
ncbi:MAG: DUF3368 domain-containing protein [Planctomycetes bacterium]|nr:DUF3368 domain-containing protein [Planctomycetota bacterium]